MDDNTSSSYNLYRRLAYGNLVDIFVLDTRIAARDKQKGSVAPTFLADYYDKDQDMLGDTQMEWLKQQLVASTAQWKVVMQSVLVAPLTLAGTLALNMDAWDGYHANRAELLESIVDNQIDNVVFLSGDLHSTVVTDIPKETTVDVTSWTDWWFQKAFYLLDKDKSYESIAVEFLVTSVSAVSRATILMDWLPNCLLPLGEWILNGVAQTASGIWWSIPHFQFIDLQNLGYQIVDFQSHRVQVDVYFTGSVTEEIDKYPTQAEQYQISFLSYDGDNSLQGVKKASVATTNYTDAALPFVLNG
jgi:alkaline phosphatase D